MGEKGILEEKNKTFIKYILKTIWDVSQPPPRNHSKESWGNRLSWKGCYY